MSKNRIRLTESDLHRIIKESVRKILRENNEQPDEKQLLDDYDNITKEKIEQCFDAVCFHYFGTRWTDIGIVGKAVAAFRNLFAEYPSITVRGMLLSSSSASGAYRNVANSNEESFICIQNADDDMIRLNLSWYQLGFAYIRYNGKNMVEASDNSIKISDEFVDILRLLC